MPTENDNLIPVFVPALVALLVRAEQLKGSPLTEDEVIRIRDNSVCTMVPHNIAAKMTAERGYSDIDPEDCWNDWQTVREEIILNSMEHH